jgi:hypothetical protein
MFCIFFVILDLLLIVNNNEDDIFFSDDGTPAHSAGNYDVLILTGVMSVESKFC